MTYRFSKRVFNDENGTRTLAFYRPQSVLQAINPFAKKDMLISFNLNELEDLRIEMGDVDFAVMITRAIGAAAGFQLTPEEIEYAVEDI
jgi:hypothetical protein